LGVDYLRAWIENIEVMEARYAKKKPEPVDSSAQRKSSSDEVRDELLKYFNDKWKRLSATSFESVEKLSLADLNEDEFCIYVVKAHPYNYGNHKEENESIDLINLIKKILKFIKKENVDLHARLEVKVNNQIGKIKRRIADGDPSELDDWPEDRWFGLTNDGVPKANWSNVYFAVKRCKINITYDEWTDEYIIQYKDAPLRSVRVDDMLPFLFEQFFDSFKFVPKEKHIKTALKIISQRPKNKVDSLLERYAQFESLSSGDFATDLK
jgi:hypothetical protein